MLVASLYCTQLTKPGTGNYDIGLKMVRPVFKNVQCAKMYKCATKVKNMVHKVFNCIFQANAACTIRCGFI